MTPTSSLVKMTHRPTRPHKQSPDPDIKAISHSIVVDDAEHVLSYGGTSQYNRDGSGASACGLAALNFARIVFSMEQSGLQDTTLLQAVLARACAEETTAICALWSGNLHLEVEDICRVPLFEKTLKLKTSTYGHPGVSEFTSLLTELSNFDSSAVAIITRPPEIIACLKLRLATRNVFIIFDSHPRPSYPNGAGMIVSPSIEGTARRLTELLPTVDLQTVFSNVHPHAVASVLESSLAQLSMQAEIAELRSQNEFLKSEQQRLESEMKEAEARSREQEMLIRQQQQQQQQQQQIRSSSGSQKYFDNSFAHQGNFRH
ncbi:hypothetical protein BGY98DRAFT_1099469 [Russula aff. rugulosa BPL654]|nr:hypothetical protein BGY98DRAFT_1099469 [Russula aff. rugulosa BPL654]